MTTTEGGHTLVVAAGDVPARAALDDAWPGWDNGVGDIIAADRGLARARAIGFEPSLLVGDLDSLDPATATDARLGGLQIVHAPVAKDESDAELALLEAVRRGARRITMLGAFGGARLDHALANVWLLAHPALNGIAVVMLDAGARVTMVSAPGPDGMPVTRALPGPPGTTITLLPFSGAVSGVTTSGLRYPLREESLVAGPARGLSNVRDAADAAVVVGEGRLLIVEIADRETGLSSTT